MRHCRFIQTFIATQFLHAHSLLQFMLFLIFNGNKAWFLADLRIWRTCLTIFRYGTLEPLWWLDPFINDLVFFVSHTTIFLALIIEVPGARRVLLAKRGSWTGRKIGIISLQPRPFIFEIFVHIFWRYRWQWDKRSLINMNFSIPVAMFTTINFLLFRKITYVTH